MTKAYVKTDLTTRTVHIGSRFAAGAIMLSRLNRSELSRYDDLMADLSRLRTPKHPATPGDPQRAPRNRWMEWMRSKR